MSPQLLLVVTVAVVGVLHTIVPDHWLPITIVARQEGWDRRETARVAFGAGLGHSLSTLALGVAVWVVGAAAATRFGQAVSEAAGAALVGFGLWIAVASIRDLRRAPESHGHSHHHVAGAHHHHDHEHAHSQPYFGHRHLHRHDDGRHHAHFHRHTPSTWHGVEGNVAVALLHEHGHNVAPRTALLFILGSSPMVEGIPAFLAASRFGVPQLAVMAVVFTVSTTATYVALCLASATGLQRLGLGPLERYGQILSGAFIALVGLVFLLWTP